MTKNIFIIVILVLAILLITSCSSTPAANVALLTSSIQASPEAVQETVIVSPLSGSSVLLSSTPSPAGTPEDKWYDWDTVGTPPINNQEQTGASIVSDDRYIYFFEGNTDKKEIDLVKSLSDGSNNVILDKIVQNDPDLKDKKITEHHLNYLDGWVYYSVNSNIYRIRPDGSEKMHILSSNKVGPIYAFIVIKDKIYYTDGFSSFLYRCDFNGNITDLNLRADDGSFLYDKSCLYYVNEDSNDKCFLKAYSISKNKNIRIPTIDVNGVDTTDYLVHNNIIYTIVADFPNVLTLYDLNKKKKESYSCDAYKMIYNLALFNNNILFLAKTSDGGSVIQYSIVNNEITNLCDFAMDTPDIFTSRSGIYLCDSIGKLYYLKDDNGQYSVVPISAN